jgi:hypothetical protein
MYAKEINKKIKTYNVLPSTYSGKKYYLAGFEKLSKEELEEEGFFEVETPDYDSRVQELKELKFNKTKGKFVYSVKNKSFSESVSELKSKVIENLKTKRDLQLEPTKNLALEAFETGIELSEEIKNERAEIRKKYENDLEALNKLSKKIDIVKFL